LNKISDNEVEAWITSAREGDEQARAHLVHAFWEPLHQHLISRTQVAEDAEDATVIAFTKALNALSDYQSEFAFSTWLFRIGQNSLIDLHRKKKETTISLDDEFKGKALMAVLSDRPSAGSDPEQVLMRAQRHQAIQEVVQQLKPHYRQLVELRYMKEMSYDEISTALDMPLGSVKGKLLRARGLLLSLFQLTEL